MRSQCFAAMHLANLARPAYDPPLRLPHQIAPRHARLRRRWTDMQWMGWGRKPHLDSYTAPAFAGCCARVGPLHKLHHMPSYRPSYMPAPSAWQDNDDESQQIRLGNAAPANAGRPKLGKAPVAPCTARSPSRRLVACSPQMPHMPQPLYMCDPHARPSGSLASFASSQPATQSANQSVGPSAWAAVWRWWLKSVQTEILPELNTRPLPLSLPSVLVAVALQDALAAPGMRVIRLP